MRRGGETCPTHLEVPVHHAVAVHVTDSEEELVHYVSALLL